MATLPTIRPNGDGFGSTWVSTAATFWEAVDDDPESATDADYISAPNAASGTQELELGAMPADFDSMLTLTLTWRGRMVNYVNDTYTITVQVHRLSGSSVFTDVETLTRPGSSFVNETVTFSGVVPGTKALWDDTQIEFTVTWAGSMGTDTGVHLDISAFELNGTYTAAAAAAPGPAFRRRDRHLGAIGQMM